MLHLPSYYGGMKLSNAVDAYILSRETAGYAPNTIRNNRSHLWALIDTVGDIPVTHITIPTMEKAWRALGEGRSNATLIQHLATYNKFFSWCAGRNIVGTTWPNPCKDIRSPKTQKRERFRVPVTDFNHLLDCAYDPRDRGILAIAITLMLRQSEIATLTVGDVNLADGEITVVIHKTNTSDTMPIPAELDTELRRWLTHYTNKVGPLADDMYLFPSRWIEKFQKDHLGRFVFDEESHYYRPYNHATRIEDVATKAMTAAGYTLGKWEGMHTLRRSAARALFDRLVDDGYDGAIRMVQAMLHHSTITTTEKYIGLTLDKKRRDDILRGQTMYPAMHTTDITQLRAVQ